MSRITTSALVIALAAAFTSPRAWSAGSNDNRFARQASDAIGPFLALGSLSLLSDGKRAKQEELQAAKALAVTALATEALKLTVREKRPNSDSRTSFPSGHASAAFAMATILAEYKPRYAWEGYGVASIIGWSRVELHAHRWHDVAAGALLGHAVAQHFCGKHIGISPMGLSYMREW